jgi:15-cis-phytoene desaturase
MATFDAVIIGGGLAGLTCAVALASNGLKVAVIEREKILGGRARSWTDCVTGDPVSIGPHILLSEYPNMLKLLCMLGTADKVIWQKDAFITMVSDQHRIIMKMARVPAPFHFVPSLLADPTLSNRDWLSNSAITLYAMSISEDDLLRLDWMPALELLKRFRVSPAYIQRFWAFISMAIMNVPLELCSAASILRFYQRLNGKNGYHVGFPDGGLGDLFVPAAERIIISTGGVILRGIQAAHLLGGGRVSGVALCDGRHLEAPFSVAAVPPRALQRMLQPEWLSSVDSLRNLGSFKSSPYISVYLWFDRKLTDLRFWSRIHKPGDWNLDFYDLSNICRSLRKRPSIIASNIIYSSRLGEITDAEVIARTISELSEFLPEAANSKLEHAVVNRIPMAIPAPVPGWEHLRPKMPMPLPGLALAGDWLQTGLPASMESACMAGWRAAECILAEFGRPQRLAETHRELNLSAAVLGAGVRALRKMAAPH